MKQLASQFRIINANLVTASQQIPIDILLHQIFNTVDNKLERVKSDLVSSQEMEALLTEVELGQKKLD